MMKSSSISLIFRSKLLFIVPHYNNINKLKRCIKSIYNNITNNCSFEVLIIDDFSDQNIRIKLKYYKIKNTGVSNARNIGIKYAIDNNFSHITFIDCDDHLISGIQTSDFEYSDLTIFESVETYDEYDEYDEYKEFISKKNINDIQDLGVMLLQYSIRPNQIRTISSCWAKVYSLKPIIENKIYFNTKMKKFEDIHFLMNYLLFSDTFSFKNFPVYAHTNSNTYVSETFIRSGGYNSFFSFLLLPKILNKLFNKFNISDNFNRHHFLACYYSIGFIRVAINLKSIVELIKLYIFIKKRLQSKFVKRCFYKYNYRSAGGRLSFKILILLNLPLVLIFVLWEIARRRYR